MFRSNSKMVSIISFIQIMAQKDKTVVLGSALSQKNKKKINYCERFNCRNMMYCFHGSNELSNCNEYVLIPH